MAKAARRSKKAGDVIGGGSEIKVACAFDKMVPIAKLKPNPKNPNKHPKSQIAALAKLIEHLGWRAPVTVSNRSGMVVRGHGRIDAAKLLGLETAPVDFQDYASEADEWTDLLADNRIPEFADMDQELTAEILKGLKLIEADIELAGYSERDFEKLIEAAAKDEEHPEVEFTRELKESQNYIVLVFDNDIDWIQAQSVFELKTVKALHSRPGFEAKGIGRVINGAKAIERIIGARWN